MVPPTAINIYGLNPFSAFHIISISYRGYSFFFFFWNINSTELKKKHHQTQNLPVTTAQCLSSQNRMVIYISHPRVVLKTCLLRVACYVYIRCCYMKINIFYWCLMGMVVRGWHTTGRTKRPVRDSQLKWCMLQQHNSFGISPVCERTFGVLQVLWHATRRVVLCGV